MKDYIAKQIEKRGLDKYDQILIDFNGTDATDEEIIKAAKRLGYKAESAEGDIDPIQFKYGTPYGYWWIYKEV